MKPSLFGLYRIGHYLLSGAAIFAVVALPISCGVGVVPAPAPSQGAAGTGSSRSQLAAGYAIHQAKCANCHAFQNPSAFTPDYLTNKVMPKMARKAKLSAAEQQAVLAYLLAVRKP